MFKRSKIVVGIVVVLIFIGGAYAAYAKGFLPAPVTNWIHSHLASTPVAQTQNTATYATKEEADPYVRFDMELYDSIGTNYWASLVSFDLPNLYKQALDKVTSKNNPLSIHDRNGTAAMIAEALKNATSSDAKRDMVAMTGAVVLYNLPPIGRNGLHSEQQETEFRQYVSNVNPSSDLYGDLGVAKNATVDQVKTAFAEKSAALEGTTSESGKAELAKVTYAKEVLTNNTNRTLYNDKHIEPTVFSHVYGQTLYVYNKRVSPTTIQEVQSIFDNASTTPHLENLIIDLRGNIGGAFDFMQMFMGFFVGQGKYAFTISHKDQKQSYPTLGNQLNSIKRYKNIVMMVDGDTKSTAELTAVDFKYLGLATIVGKRTGGWGTIENSYEIKAPIDPHQKYFAFLVNNVTVRPDGTLIEGNGMQPDVDMAQQDWQQKLPQFIKSADLITAIKKVGKGPVSL